MQPKSATVMTQPSEFIVLLGRNDIEKSIERGSQIAYPVKVTIHPDWNYAEMKYDGDIALIFLEQEVMFSPFISPICLSLDQTRNTMGTVVSNNLN